MRIFSPPVLSEAEPCPYLENEQIRQEYFAAAGLNPAEFQTLLNERWRRFGTVFFRPVCPECKRCRPIRVNCTTFKASKSQRRILKKNLNTKVLFRNLQEKEGMYELYEKHSRIRFDQDCSREEFRRNFFNPGVPSFQSEYYVDETLAAFGFLDLSSDGLSSVYFCFDPEFEAYNLGSYSIMREVQECASMGLSYYYLGYYIKETERMAYKGRFKPHEILGPEGWQDGDALKESVGTSQKENIKEKE